MLLIVKKELQIKYHDKNKESSCLKYWDGNDLYGWAISQKLPLNKYEWIEDTFSLNNDFIKKL